MTQPLLTPIKIGDLLLPNRVFMASMTRGRTNNPGLIPNDLNVEYYTQRASAGLILTEGSWPSPQAVGYVNAPGLYSDEQVDGWHRVVDSVHAAGGHIFAQLGHVGAMSHPDYFSGEAPAGPSAINPQQRVFTPQGFKETVTPRAISLHEIEKTLEDFAASAKKAKAAGFDGIELHAHQPYLIPQFLNENLNQRRDAYGGSIENRTRFLFDALQALVSVWGPQRVGIKLNPGLTGVGGFNATSQTIPTYEHIFQRLNDIPLAYVQLMRPANDLQDTAIASLKDNVLQHFRPIYKGTLVANGGFNAQSANQAISDGLADAVSFAQPFIANPDLVRRIELQLPIAEASLTTRYAGGAEGYTDYPEA